MDTTTAALDASASSTVPRWVWLPQLVVAGILGSTLPFKFSAAPESVALFEALGAEPWGRLGTGVLEAVAVLLLLVPRTAAVGGALALGLMSGAIFSHLTKLGISIDGDPSLFLMAVVAFVASAAVVWLRRRELPVVGSKL